MQRQRRTRSDSGMTEVASMIFVIPLLVAMLFTMIEVSMYLHMRSQVENVVNTATAGAANDGGNYWVRTNSIGEPWDDWATTRINEICGARCGFAPTTPNVTCTPDVVDALPYAVTTYSTDGGFVSCTTTIKFNALTGAFMDGPMGLAIGRVANGSSNIAAKLPASRSERGFGF